MNILIAAVVLASAGPPVTGTQAIIGPATSTQVIIGPIPTDAHGNIQAPHPQPGVVIEPPEKALYPDVHLSSDASAVLLVSLKSLELPGNIVAFNTRGTKLWVKTLDNPHYINGKTGAVINYNGLGYHEWDIRILPGTAVKADGDTIWFSPYETMEAPNMTFPAPTK